VGSRGPVGGPYRRAMDQERQKRSENARNSPDSARNGRSRLRMPLDLRQNPAAATFWRNHARDLEAEGRLDRRHVDSFAELCRLVATIASYIEIIASQGAVVIGPRGAQTKHPLCTPLAQAQRLYVDFSARFGLDPASQGRLPDLAKVGRSLPYNPQDAYYSSAG